MTDTSIRADDLAAAVDHLRTADPALAPLMDRVGPCELALTQTASVFEALAEAIVYQQLHGKAAATIFGRVVALCPPDSGGLCAERILALPDDDLRGAGLSRQKLLAIRDLARKTVDGEIPEIAAVGLLPDEEIIGLLTKVRGIGRWTAEMLLIFRLGRLDVLPVDDYGVRKGYAIAFGLAEPPKPKELAACGERWAPYRSVVSWYFWRAAELGGL